MNIPKTTITIFKTNELIQLDDITFLDVLYCIDSSVVWFAVGEMVGFHVGKMVGNLVWIFVVGKSVGERDGLIVGSVAYFQ